MKDPQVEVVWTGLDLMKEELVSYSTVTSSSYSSYPDRERHHSTGFTSSDRYLEVATIITDNFSKKGKK